MSTYVFLPLAHLLEVFACSLVHPGTPFCLYEMGVKPYLGPLPGCTVGFTQASPFQRQAFRDAVALYAQQQRDT